MKTARLDFACGALSCGRVVVAGGLGGRQNCNPEWRLFARFLTENECTECVLSPDDDFMFQFQMPMILQMKVWRGMEFMHGTRS